MTTTAAAQAITFTTHAVNGWVAQITGLDARYGLARQFEAKRDVTEHRGNRKRDLEYTLTDGLYEVAEDRDRYFVRVENATVTYIERDDVVAAFAL